MHLTIGLFAEEYRDGDVAKLILKTDLSECRVKMTSKFQQLGKGCA